MNAEKKWTPGPLLAMCLNETDKPWAVVKSGGRLGDRIIGGYMSKDDATLYAASPDMAEALAPFAALLDIFEFSTGLRPTSGEICSWVDHRVGERVLTVEHLEAARAALRKAGAL